MSQGLTATLFTPSSTQNPSFEVFGNYLLLKRIGSGGMAEVFLARPAYASGNGRVMVIKRILPHMADDPVFVNMFRAEVQVMMGFNHPHTVQLHDFGEVNNQLFIAMEYIEGKSLKQIISTFKKKNEAIPVPMVLSLIAQAAAGLSYAHRFENKVTGEIFNAVHRDISPQNLILSYDGNLKVIDFGIAKADSGTAERTRTGVIKGKVAYLSPEQILGEELDGRADIFSLGIVAWELLTFKRPFSEENDSELTIMGKIENCEKNILPPSTLNNEVPPAVDALVMRALKKNPGDRYSTAHEFQTAIRGVMRQHYSDYAYSDTGELTRALFESEISQERYELREINELAQASLTPDSSSVTRVNSAENPSATMSSVVRGIRAVAPNLTESRLANIEALMKQKATGRHYFLVGLYMLSLVAIKLDDRYSILDRLLGPPGNYQVYNALNKASPPPYSRLPARVSPAQGR
jgi:serine/threonine protein kinase